MNWRLAMEIAAVFASFLIARYFFPSYASEKAKNLATKQDIAGIQSEIENVALTFAGRKRLTEKQSEIEIDAYRVIWDAIVEVGKAAEQLRPVLDTMPADDVAREQRRHKRFKTMQEALQKLLDGAYKQRPFYPREVFTVIEQLLTVARLEMIQFAHEDPQLDRDYWEKAMKNAKEIRERSEQVGEAIRERLANVSATE
jgi:hypothetical protein